MIRITRPAMGCEFELVLSGKSREYLIAAAEQAFEEVQRLEEQFSVFISTSEISYINDIAAREPVHVEPRLFRLLQTAMRLYHETEGAFDITAGALIDLWSSAESMPSEHDIASVLTATGMSKVILDEGERTVRFTHPGIKLNLGAIGKGYAAAEVVEFLKELEIDSALVAAGTSTVYALGCPPDDDAWTIGIRNPVERDERITSVRLRDQALSTSGSHERFVEIDGVSYSHIIDPSTGYPARGLLLACAIVDDPIASDALSTAFFLQGIEWTKAYCESRGRTGAIIVEESVSGEQPVVHKYGVR